MSFRLGLTGGIGMGKSTAAGIFRELGHPVWDADAAVHRLYAAGGAAVQPVGAAFPGTVKGHAVDRAALKVALASDPNGFARLEAIVHPLVARDRADFIATHPLAPIVVLDIPLLFEGGLQAQLDGVAVVSVPPDVQRQRVMARPGMTEQTFQMILSRQMPDAQKRALADWVIPSLTLQDARAAIVDICDQLMRQAPHA
ncbi:dephospho-CoA kinase [Paracoccus shanxieyensis]|uniref:Dephospho-CoA kinase n=1 Tax=Paracoccus shanxieyensis TaxID=2675752 RepID=A0A6L6J055_9RHOB|nr:dephospho-CoA kinase [Paracoccus shanxieyensis]MTH65218.1 dephospho-CoA kinase [Paracoccus shanxieyensis]MTH88478.1 dephospho-CoA kinase [Paracoccus shanxieyensis]